MSVTSTRSTTITYSGDVTGTETIDASTNTASPGAINLISLTTGDNTITVPTGGSTVRAATILPPSGNTTLITLKGVGGDTGIALHNTDPCTVSFGSGVSDFVLNAAAAITGVRIYWS